MAYTAENLVNTSVDDLRNSLLGINDVPLLQEALRLSIQRNHVTRAQLLNRRIKKLQK